MWVVGSSQGWTRGPDLPTKYGFSAVTSPEGSKLLVVDGMDDDPATYSKSFYQLEFKDGLCWQWTKLDHHGMADPRYGPVTMLVPDSFC